MKKTRVEMAQGLIPSIIPAMTTAVTVGRWRGDVVPLAEGILGKDQLSRALENQAELDQDLRVLLELLMSENRAKSIENEKACIREYLKQLGVILRQEKDIQGRTAGGGRCDSRLAEYDNR
jgi:hypothetical protein